MNIFLHHRDIRYQDNTTMIKMYKEIGEPLVPIFIFPPEQINPKKNKYFSDNLVQFMCESLDELDDSYKKKKSKIHLFEGDNIDILEKIHKKNKIKSLGFNVDYSPYAKERDNKIKKWCDKNGIDLYTEEDMLLVDILEGKTKSKASEQPYRVFTPFMRYLRASYRVEKIDNTKVKYTKFNSQLKEELNTEDMKKFYKKNKDLNVKSGREEAKKKLKLLKIQTDYDKCRNFLTYNTSHLSAYINLGLLSIREVYHHGMEKLGGKSGFITELYWRDFYYNILHFFGHVIGKSFRPEYDNIKWRNDSKQFKAWCDGKTGFPVVDACMRQMNTIGWMHNRGRMIVASFLTKDLLIDWRKGERYFANKLMDYNMSANNGGWQWAAGSGTDAQPYFRIFNPWTQSENFDKDCEYIKKWIPELKSVENKHIHHWDKFCKEYDVDYPEPIVDHKKERENTLKVYKKYL